MIPPRVSVIIPTVNEAEELPGVLAALRGQTMGVEIIVVDGGSEDATVERARAGGARVVRSARRQRAYQLNLGAGVATGSVLWMLHGDTVVDRRACAAIVRALEDREVVGGGFRRRFRSASPLLWLTSRLADWRSRRWGLFFGDQSIFVRREVFEELEGLAEMPVFEDFDFCRRMRERGRVVCLGPPVRSSARRFLRRGALAVTLRDAWLTQRYLRGKGEGRSGECGERGTARVGGERGGK